MQPENNETNIEDKDVLYRLTPKGLLSCHLDGDTLREVVDAIELYLRRHNTAIAIDDNQLRFVPLERVD